jgi:hypothetical protein
MPDSPDLRWKFKAGFLLARLFHHDLNLGPNSLWASRMADSLKKISVTLLVGFEIKTQIEKRLAQDTFRTKASRADE